MKYDKCGYFSLSLNLENNEFSAGEPRMIIALFVRDCTYAQLRNLFA
jgi:hypothetical protein